MRDYWIIVNSDNVVIGKAEVRKDSMTREQIMTPHEGATEAFKVTEEIFDEQRHGERFTGD